MKLKLKVLPFLVPVNVSSELGFLWSSKQKKLKLKHRRIKIIGEKV